MIFAFGRVVGCDLTALFSSMDLVDDNVEPPWYYKVWAFGDLWCLVMPWVCGGGTTSGNGREGRRSSDL